VIALDQPIAGQRLSWSNSRAKLFQDCKRAYWFNYYAKYHDDEVARLANLDNIYTWAGTVVHDAIEAFLKTHNFIPDAEEREEIIRAVTHGQMRQDWQFSQAGMKRFRLFEHEYGVPISEYDKKVLVGQVQTCLQNFFEGSVLHDLMEVGKDNWITVEDLFGFEVDGFWVTGKMVVAYRFGLDDQTVIVDWKTARNPDASWSQKANRIQVGVYSLYAFHKGWARRVDNITTSLEYLAVPTSKVRIADMGALADARTHIVKTASEMVGPVLDVAKNTTKGEDFPQCGVEWRCRRCYFKRLCFPGGGV